MRVTISGNNDDVHNSVSEVGLKLNLFIFSSTSNTWFVGTVVGHQYGWLKNSSESASSKRWIPDLKTGWEYRPLVRSSDSLASNTWLSDDGSLRIESLRGIKMV